MLADKCLCKYVICRYMYVWRLSIRQVVHSDCGWRSIKSVSTSPSHLPWRIRCQCPCRLIIHDEPSHQSVHVTVVSYCPWWKSIMSECSYHFLFRLKHHVHVSMSMSYMFVYVCMCVGVHQQEIYRTSLCMCTGKCMFVRVCIMLVNVQCVCITYVCPCCPFK